MDAGLLTALLATPSSLEWTTHAFSPNVAAAAGGMAFSPQQQQQQQEEQEQYYQQQHRQQQRRQQQLQQQRQSIMKPTSAQGNSGMLMESNDSMMTMIHDTSDDTNVNHASSSLPYSRVLPGWEYVRYSLDRKVR